MRLDIERTILVIILMAVLGGCGQPTPEPPPRPNLLVGLEGDVQLKRAGWTDYIPVGFGTLLQYDDLLTVDESALVLCGDLTVASVEGRESCPCPPASGRLTYRGAYYRISSDVSGALENLPYILYPRNTLVLSSRPRLRWHDTGDTSYTVSLMSGQRTIWSRSNVTSSVISYPDDAPRLRSGAEYRLSVQGNITGKHSQDDPAEEVGFRVLSEAGQERVEAERVALLSLGSVDERHPLDEPARDLAQAIYYATYPPSAGENERQLWGEAWLLLESMAQEQDSPAVHLWMGDVLAMMTLPIEAKAAYRAALESAEALGDLESQAAAHAGLWRMTGDGNRFERAIALYEQLGDQDAIRALEAERNLRP